MTAPALIAAAAAAAVLTLAPATAPAVTGRVALLVAHPFGGEELQPLRYTANDLERVREVLTSWGGFAEEDVLVSYAEDADTVLDAFAEARGRLAQAKAAGKETLFVFYYTGHAKDGELRLGDSRLAMAEVKRQTESSDAKLRLAVIDACRAGSFTQLKGAVKGAPIEVGLESEAAQAGQVLIAASSENEDAQESDDIQGSYFTYFLTSGLRGAADSDGDGRVTLAEAYGHAYSGTVLRTVGTRGGVQHPSYHFDLRGAGDVVLTELTKKDSLLIVPADASGPFTIFDAGRRIVVAEFDKAAGTPASVLLSPGDYVVKKRETAELRMLRVRVPAHTAIPLDLEAMEPVAFADDYAKGSRISVDDIRYGRIGVRLTAGVGGQSFLSAPARADYFPNLALGFVQMDLTNLLRRDLGVRFDLGVGQSGENRLALSDDYLGDLSYRITVSEVTAGAALTGTLHLTRRLSVGALARLGLILVTRHFVDGEMGDQLFSTLTPGVGAEIQFAATSWLSAGFSVRAHYMFFNVDSAQSLAYIDAALVVTTVLR